MTAHEGECRMLAHKVLAKLMALSLNNVRFIRFDGSFSVGGAAWGGVPESVMGSSHSLSQRQQTTGREDAGC